MGNPSGATPDSTPAPDKTTAGAGTGTAGAEGTPSGKPADEGGEDTSLLGSAGAAKDTPKPGEDGKPTQPQGAPEKYEDFKLPDGVTVDPKATESFKATAKELGLTQTQAQKLVDFQASLIAQAEEANKANYAEMRKEWKDATVKMLGKDAEKSLALAAKARDVFGTKELTQFLNESGLGDHPEVVRFFTAIGKALSEDPLAEGKQTQGEKTIAKRVYPNLK